MTAKAPDRMPAIFFGHGNPMNALARNPYTEAWSALGASVRRPRAILSVSAHWYTWGTAVTAMERPRTVHDFGGFPRELFEFEYPAPGDALLAGRVRELLAPSDVQADTSWGLDHGTWSVLAHAFPDATIPVVQLSIDRALSPALHYERARRLAPLRGEGVLVVGSGNVVHNLALMRWEDGAAPYDWAVRFNDRVRKCLTSSDHDALLALGRGDTDARLAVPTPDHYLPLLYVAAVQQEGEGVSIPVDGIEMGSVSMLAAAVGTLR